MSAMFRALFLLLTVLVLSACNFTKDMNAASRAAETFHTQLNAEAYDDIYTAADPRLRAATSQADFDRLLGVMHRKLGAFQSAGQPSVFVKSGTGGTYVTLTSRSQFEKSPAREQFVFVVQDDGARLVSYDINAMALLAD